MNRRPPPPPTCVLDALLARLRREAERFPMDPSLPGLVERSIRRRRRTHRLTLAATVALAFSAPWALPAGIAVSPAPAHAGPQEARELYERARALRSAPWREQVDAWRAVVLEANDQDRIGLRALLAMAEVLREASHPHGAAAAEAFATASAPRTDETRVRALLRHGKALRAEGDAEAAHAVLRAVLEDARSETPKAAEEALDVLSADAFHAGDLAAVAGLDARAARDEMSPALRLKVLDRLGRLRHAAGDLPGAQRALSEASRVARAAEGRDDAESLLVTRLWLDLPLRKLL